MSLPFVADVIKTIKQTKLNKQTADHLTDEIYQMYLRTLPARSMRRSYIHRKGVSGFSKDAIRALAEQGFKQSRQQAKLNHIDVLDNQIEEIKKYTSELSNHVEVDRITEELTKRHAWVQNPQRAAWAQKMTNAGFVWMLGLTPAAALVNLTQNIQVALPVIGAQHGFANASSEMLKASQEFMRAATKRDRPSGRGILGSILTGSEKEAFVRAIKQGSYRCNSSG